MWRYVSRADEPLLGILKACVERIEDIGGLEIGLGFGQDRLNA
jgi:hypothetical protein